MTRPSASPSGLRLRPALLALAGTLALLTPACHRRENPPAQAAGATILSFDPTSQLPGQTVTLLGSGFIGATQVAFAGVQAQDFKVVSEARITVTVPAAAASGRITVVTAGGTATSATDFTVLPLPALPVVGSFTPTQGQVGQEVAVTGTGFTGATAVAFDGVPAVVLRVVDDTRILANVPTGAGTGLISVVTPAGRAFSNGDFTVLPPAPQAPQLTGFLPAAGVPGTEVTLTGTHLGGVTRVTYGGLALDARRYDLDSDTQLRVRVPDDAQAGSVLQVETGAGLAQTAAFTLLPSRRAALPQALAQVEGAFGAGPWVNFPGPGRSAIYGLAEPFAPVFHAYNPDGHIDDAHSGARPGHLFQNYTVSLKLPQPFLPFLPASVRDRITAQGLDPAQVDLLCASQDYMFDGTSGVGGIYLFRPHYWTDPLAPVAGVYNVGHTLSAGLFETDPGVTLSGQPAGTWLTFGISTHGPGAAAGDIVVSGNSEPMAGFDVTLSTGLWTLTQEGTRAAATLHLLFNDADQAALDTLVKGTGTLQELLLALKQGPMGASRGVQMLLDLARPELTQVTLKAVGGTQEATLTGTCLTGATAVLLNGAPVTGFQALSDAVVRVTLPGSAAGTLQVVTAMGTSAPLSLR